MSKIDGVIVGKTKYSNKSVLEQRLYADGTLAIRGTNPDDGLPNFTATVWLETPPSDGCVWLKGWSENEGVPEALVAAGVVKLTGRKQASGFVDAVEAKLRGAGA